MSVKVVSFNSRHELLRCVGEAVAMPETEVSVVDNASGDGRAEAIEAQFPNVRVIRNADNWTLSLYRLVGKQGPDRFFDPDRDYERACDVEEVSGACLMTRSDVLDRVGLLDDNFFYCFVEFNLCISVRRSGFRVVYVADACLTHARASVRRRRARRSPGTSWLATTTTC